MEGRTRFLCVDNPNANELTIHILAAVAQDESTRISERTKAGLERTRRAGTRLGRPPTDADKLAAALKLRGEGLSFSQIGTRLGVTRARAFQLVKAALHSNPETA